MMRLQSTWYKITHKNRWLFFFLLLFIFRWCTPVYQKPHAIEPIYEKPHAYDETPPVVTASRHSSRSSRTSRTTVDSSRYFQRKSSMRSTASTATDFGLSTASSSLYQETYSPHTPNIQNITSFILSQSSPTIQGIFGTEAHIHSIRHAPSYASFKLNNNTDNKISTVKKVSSVDHIKIPEYDSHHTILPNVISYDVERTSRTRSDQYSLYHTAENGERTLFYRKIQPHSYYGSQSMLYRTLESYTTSGEGVKVAEARRSLFQKDVIIETADYDGSQCDIKHIVEKRVSAINIHSHELVKRSHSSILFEYETSFHGTLIRWKRPSLLSHDFTCEIKLRTNNHHLRRKKNKSRRHAEQEGFIDSDSDNDEDDHDHHSHKTCRKWRLLAEYRSENSGPFSLQLGKLSMDGTVLNQIGPMHRNALEANLVLSCCLLLDGIRDQIKRAP
ncbi:hypothetical protein BDB01DRAFT_781523 [Pilobolus umbonatus]|nr:hypothetical protein BDB01DRAFT_781523 [Pilobolus umbonatus]